MGQLKRINLLAVIILFIFTSCKSQDERMESNVNELLEQKLTELVYSYVKMLREETGDFGLFCIYVERGDDNKLDFYKYRFYDGAILSENLDLPYTYINSKVKENFVIFFFDEEKKIPKSIRKSLEQDSLWVSLSKIDDMKKYRPVIKTHSYPVWEVFMCKDDINKYKIYESAFGLEEDNKIIEICK